MGAAKWQDTVGEPGGLRGALAAAMFGVRLGHEPETGMQVELFGGRDARALRERWSTRSAIGAGSSDGRSLIWSYGGGVQSAAIAVLVLRGELPRPERAVMADTSREASATGSDK